MISAAVIKKKHLHIFLNYDVVFIAASMLLTGVLRSSRLNFVLIEGYIISLYELYKSVIKTYFLFQELIFLL